MTNLFSVFDPNVFKTFPLNWASSMLVLTLLPPLFWLSSTQAKTFLSQIFKLIHNEFAAILGPRTSPGNILLSLTLFALIALNNFIGLSPYTFTSSSHLTFSLSLALPLWVGHMTYSMICQPSTMLAHLVPLGTPYPLMPLMVIIEIVSSVIRPLTLAVRLAANMVAGHLLLVLISGQAAMTPTFFAPMVILGICLLGILESAVALIQAYVFSVLMTLYLSEVDSKIISVG